MTQYSQQYAYTTKLIALFVCLFMAGCKVSVNSNNDKASVRVLHASPNAPNLDFKINDINLIKDVAFKAASSFQRIDAGRKALSVSASNTGVNHILSTYDFSRDRAYTIIVSNRLSAIEPILLEDESTGPLLGQSKLRLVHAAADAATLDVYITSPNAAISTATPRWTNIAYKTIGASLQISAGNYQVRATVSGTKNVIYDSGAVVIPTGGNIVLVAVEQRAGTSPISLIGLTADSNSPRFEWSDTRAKLQFSPELAKMSEVDLLIDDELVRRDSLIGTNVSDIDLRPGIHSVKVNIGGVLPSVFNETINVISGRKYEIILSSCPLTSSPVIKIIEHSALE